MNTTVSLLIVGISLLVFFLLLHIYNLRKEKAVKRERLKAIKMIAREHIDLAEKEIINNQLIGLDKSKKILVISDLEMEENDLTEVPLLVVSYCRLDEQTQNVVHRGRNRTVSEELLNKISLLFFSPQKKQLFEFVFFDAEKNGLHELPHLIERAEYWKKLIMETGITEFV